MSESPNFAWKPVVLLAALWIVITNPAALFGVEGSDLPKRARPPKWSRDVVDEFFSDARKELSGTRPDYEKTAIADDSAQEKSRPSSSDTEEFKWSWLIDADTLETEVKRLSDSIAEAVKTPSEFKGGGYKTARRDFSELAVMFAVAAQHDGHPRWHDVAAGWRDLVARAGSNCKVGTDSTYREALARHEDLADLVRGGRPQVSKADTSVAEWSKIADRPSLMQRLDLAHEERVTKWLGDATSFRRHRTDIRHEAQIMATLAETIGREGFDFWDEDEYSSYARQLSQAAADLDAAATSDDFSQARAAADRATKACARCHEDYRG
jgi:hypothetical protein